MFRDAKMRADSRSRCKSSSGRNQLDAKPFGLLEETMQNRYGNPLKAKTRIFSKIFKLSEN
jgi:hypothetical protein